MGGRPCTEPPPKPTEAAPEYAVTSQPAEFPEQNPSPVLRVSRGGTLLYANTASANLLKTWGCRPGEAVPEPIRRHAEKALNAGHPTQAEVSCDPVCYSFFVTPIPGQGYANLYGRDITHQKQVDLERDQLLKRHVVLVKVAQQVLDTTDLPDLLQKVVAAARELTGARLGMAGHHEDTALHLMATSFDQDFADPPSAVHFSLPNAEPCLGFIYHTPSVRLTDAALQGRPMLRNRPSGHPRLRGLAAARLIGPDQQPTGLIVVSDKAGGGEFTTEDEVALRQLANITSLAVRLIKARDEARDHARESLASAKALRESEARMRTMLEHMPIGVWFTDPDGAITYGNTAAKRIWAGARYVGVEEFHEYKGRWYPSGEPIPPEDWAVVRAVRQGETSLNEVIEIDCFDGTRKIIHNSAVPIPAEAGRIDGAVIINEDISKRIAAEEALRDLNNRLEEKVRARTDALTGTVDQLRIEVIHRLEAEQQARDHARMLEGFFRHTITPLAFMDHRFRFIRVNESYARVGGRDPDFYVGKNHFDLYPDEKNRTIFEQVVRTKTAFYARAKPFTHPDDPDQSVGYWNWQLTPLLDESGAVRFLVLNLEDVTEQENGRRELAQRAQQLQELTLELSQAENRERKRLADVLHDDLQQQLAAIRFHLGNLGEQAVSANPSIEPMLDQIDQMLSEAVHKSRTLAHELSPAVLYQKDLKKVFEWLSARMEAQYGLTVQVDTVGEVTLGREALRAFLYKAAQEILFNIVKHAGVNQAVMRLRRSDDRVHLVIADRGRGFDPRAPRKSAGFGLMSIRERIALLGGDMKIRSTPGKGSVIVITLRDT
ncbi:MAG: PAS domain-containing protein [Desulfococcaceae bacterium]